MTNAEIIEIFFSKAFEETFNEKILNDKNYVVPIDRVLSYVNEVLSVPYSDYLYQLIDVDFPPITSTDITQCSSFSSCEIDMCQNLIYEDNPGFSFDDIGRLFSDKCKTQTSRALVKYGENQIKTSRQLGLAYEYYGLWYLDVLGYVYPSLSSSQRDSLLARTILRDTFYGSIIKEGLSGAVNLSNYMKGLSNSTIGRRSRGIMHILNFAVREAQKEGIDLLIEDIVVPKHVRNTEDRNNMSTEIYLFNKRIDKSFLTRGMTIPKPAIQSLIQVIGQDLSRGESSDITVSFNNLEYGGRLTHVNFKESQADCYQIFWKGKPSITEAFLLFFNDLNEQATPEIKIFGWAQSKRIDIRISYPNTLPL